MSVSQLCKLRVRDSEGFTGSIVLPGYQKRGIGTALVTCIEQEARKAGIRRLILLTVEKAHWAVGFYEKLGYSLDERIERPWGFDVFMVQELGKKPRSKP